MGQRVGKKEVWMPYGPGFLELYSFVGAHLILQLYTLHALLPSHHSHDPGPAQENAQGIEIP